LECSNLLASQVIELAAVLRQLKEPAEALRQAEQGRQLYLKLRRTAPDDLAHLIGLASAWDQIGKARWDLGHVEEALAAFRESVATQRQVFEHEPSIRANRFRLSRCYRLIAYWGGLCGKRAEAAAALLEREKLWPDDAKELLDVASEFEELAKAVGALPLLEASTVGCLGAPLEQGPLLTVAGFFPKRNALERARWKLTPGEQAERQRYLDHGERAKRAAEAAAGRAGGKPGVPTLR
jgi:tetratricopeptide (TPR) repeat protein